ncbi:MAG: YXWGXW repeat-containing protein [Rhodospirillales bacterium]|nr:YXWGXW repeat-containing protein [Rhodospirillales bacterium]MDE2574024.1 YXWGXW repeat-containing protein [Rhodospirillales bacterium]
MALSLRLFACTLALGAGLSSAALAQVERPPYPPVPPLRAEVVPRPPGPRFVWEPGHWHWNGRAYVWFRGHYIRPYAHRPHYVPGHWVRRGPGWVWLRAHWQ